MSFDRIRSAFAFSAVLALASCSGDSSPAPGPTAQPNNVSTASLRFVHGSPDGGAVDIYVYASGGSQPATPIVANLAYPGISAYFSFPVGNYVVSVDLAGTKTALATETIGGTTPDAQISVALAGEVTSSTFQLQNFIEPTQTSGVSGVILHQAAPTINASIDPIGIGVYGTAGVVTPVASATTQLAALPLATAAAGSFGSSGPAGNGSVSGGEYFVSPAPTSPSPIGFAAGAPATTSLATVIASATLSGLASGLATTGYGVPPLAAGLAQTTSNVLPAGAHLSVFLIDGAASSARLIGSYDP